MPDNAPRPTGTWGSCPGTVGVDEAGGTGKSPRFTGELDARSRDLQHRPELPRLGGIDDGTAPDAAMVPLHLPGGREQLALHGRVVVARPGHHESRRGPSPSDSHQRGTSWCRGVRVTGASRREAGTVTRAARAMAFRSRSITPTSLATATFVRSRCSALAGSADPGSTRRRRTAHARVGPARPRTGPTHTRLNRRQRTACWRDRRSLRTPPRPAPSGPAPPRRRPCGPA